MEVLKMLRTLVGYTLIGLPLLAVFGVLLPFIDLKSQNYPFLVWFAIDTMICAISHGTYQRTISGWTGQYMGTKLRYKYQGKFIDKLASLFGDEPNHCQRAYQSELKLTKD